MDTRLVAILGFVRLLVGRTDGVVGLAPNLIAILVECLDGNFAMQIPKAVHVLVLGYLLALVERLVLLGLFK